MKKYWITSGLIASGAIYLNLFSGLIFIRYSVIAVSLMLIFVFILAKKERKTKEL